MTDKASRVAEWENRGIALLNDMYSKAQLERAMMRHAAVFLVFNTIVLTTFTYAMLIATGVTAPGHVVALLTGLVLGLSLWRAERRLTRFSYCDRARHFGGTQDVGTTKN